MKQYEVEINEKSSHGRYGKENYTCWCLSHTSKAGAEDFAIDILSGKTWREFITEVEEVKGKKIGPLDSIRFIVGSKGFKEDDYIGLENAERFFSFKAYKMQEGGQE